MTDIQPRHAQSNLNKNRSYSVMNPDIKAKWLKALREGEFIQAKGAYMGYQDGKIAHCCLAVLGDVLNPGDPLNCESGDVIDPEIAEPLGLSIATQATLARINDGTTHAGDLDKYPLAAAYFEAHPEQEDTGADYADIADWIEANL